MYKNFILILFALLFFTGCVTDKGAHVKISKHKCDYYTDNLSIDYVRILVNGKYKQDITGTVCDSQDKRSFIQIKNGLAHGKAEVYLPIGIFFQNNFQNGKLEGILKGYDENGNLTHQTTFKNGLREGQMKSYNSYGKFWATITYKNDKAVSGICANGKKWNNAELSNWENGLNVTCGY